MSDLQPPDLHLVVGRGAGGSGGGGAGRCTDQGPSGSWLQAALQQPPQTRRGKVIGPSRSPPSLGSCPAFCPFSWAERKHLRPRLPWGCEGSRQLCLCLCLGLAGCEPSSPGSDSRAAGPVSLCPACNGGSLLPQSAPQTHVPTACPPGRGCGRGRRERRACGKEARLSVAWSRLLLGEML